MILRLDRSPVLTRVVSGVLVFSLITVISGPPVASPGPEDNTIYSRFEDVSFLRSQGQHDSAIEILRDIIDEYSESNEVLRRAYNDLDFTLLSKEDVPTATESAKEALSRFPDLAADPVYFPPRVNEIYDGLRSQMFGTLNVATKPDSCKVFLDNEFVGLSPLNLEYVRVGEYVLSVSKSGFQDESEFVSIGPGRPTSVPLSLRKQRGRGWWLVRIGPAALVAGVLLAIQLQRDEGGGPARLPGPPPPPGW